MVIEPIFPEGVSSRTEMDAAEGEHLFGSGAGPKHARLFAACADHRFAAGLNDAGANEEATLAEAAVLHALHVVLEVAEGLLHRFSRAAGESRRARGLDDFAHAIPQQQLNPAA